MIHQLMNMWLETVSEPRKQSGAKLKMFLIQTKYLFGDRNFKRLGCLLKLFARMKFLKSLSKASDKALDVFLNRCSILKITVTLFSINSIV